ncbi:MAG: thermonuclease family protein [Alphaproteobacteria bacterium]|nr:thermonuclease family protein [Alphaproteobacteria bacterium]
MKVSRRVVYGSVAGVVALGGVALWSHFNESAGDGCKALNHVAQKGERFCGKIRQNEIHDGDTFILRSPDGKTRYKIRVWGIDAPEIKQSCKMGGKRVACGEMARDRMKELIQAANDNSIYCDMKAQDRYSRVVAQCFANEIDVGGALVKEGLAIVYRANKAYRGIQKEAEAAHRGLWAGEFMNPGSWRKSCHPKPKNGKSRPEFCGFP